MDFNNLTAKVKGFQRRTTQKVLQQMGIADKTEDDSPAFQNFLALGSFASQLKTTIQATDSGLEKACTAQAHLASQVQAYLHSEFSGDGEIPPGELSDFFSGNDAHSAILEAIAAKFCDASTEIGHHALIQVIGQLDDLILKPIQKDDEFGIITKELIEEKKRATLDFDSYRRMAQSATSPSEHEKAETKARAAKDRYDDISRRVAEHINQRNQISYQMDETQLQSTVNLGNQPQRTQDPRARSPPQGNQGKVNSLFTDYESQNRGGAGAGRPTAPSNRTGSPQLDTMMRDNLNLKKPAAGQQQPPPHRNVPMNQLNNANVGTRTPPPTHHNNHVNSPQPQHNLPPSQPAPQPQPFVDLFGDGGISQSAPRPQTPPQAPKEDILVNLMDHSTPAKSSSIFDGDLFGSGAFSAPTMPSTPAMQPTNVDIFDTTFQSSSSGKKVNSLDSEFDFLSQPKPTQKPPQQQQRPQQHQPQPVPQQQQQQGDLFGFDFGGPTPKPQPSGPPSNSNANKHKQEERHELNPAVTQRITNWAEKGGRKANLRALLSTLHEVIWVDSGWDAMSLGELITPVQVKKAYHRANLIVHPDKVQNGTVEQQLMAQRIFEALRVSYETFKDEPK